MLELVGLEAAKWRLCPRLAGCVAWGADQCGDAFLEQFAQMILEGRCELGVTGEQGVGTDEQPLVGEVPFPEAIQGLELLRLLLEAVGVVSIEIGRASCRERV